MDPVTVIQEFQGMIYAVHAKDVAVDPRNISVNGVLDSKPYGDELHRSWVFRTVGYGNGESYWRNLFTELRKSGYDGTISIEHEDSLMNREEGLRKAVKLVSECALLAEPSGIWWV